MISDETVGQLSSTNTELFAGSNIRAASKLVASIIMIQQEIDADIA
jgi:hypothetical protein